MGLVRTRELAAALVSGIVFTLAVGGWTVRNARAVGTFAPIKCNFWFDFYQANAVDDDGCISASVFFRFHPLFGNATREAYQELGEARFLASYEDRSREFLAREPGEYVRKIGCRVVNAFLYTRHEVDLAGVGDELGARDLERLREANLVGCNPHQPGEHFLWTVLQYDGDRFESELAAAGLEHPDLALQSWKRAQRRYERRVLHKDSLARSLVVSLLPTLAVLLGLLSGQVRRRASFLVCATIYVAYLAPYVVAAHYWRYQLPLLGVHTLLLLYGAEAAALLGVRFRPAWLWHGPVVAKSTYSSPAR